jgi:hypothetical protein
MEHQEDLTTFRLSENPMPVEKVNKLNVAGIQLETAITTFLARGDPFVVIALAGASEEILGRTVELMGGESAVGGLARSAALVHRHLYGNDMQERHFRRRANLARNAIKHVDSLEDLEVEFDPTEEAIDVLVRATDNYFLLGQPYSEPIQHFQDWYLKNIVGRP